MTKEILTPEKAQAKLKAIERKNRIDRRKQIGQRFVEKDF